MTDKEKQQIKEYRDQELSYSEISRMLGISVNSVKTYCKRHALGGTKAFDGKGSTEFCCEQCGIPVKQNPGRKKKRFCSDGCRMKWWNSHMDKVKRKAIYEFTCLHCGKTFTAYGNSGRKYCSHDCYIEERFGGQA